MGRHSAPDDDAVDVPEASLMAPLGGVVVTPTGRHVRAESEAAAARAESEAAAARPVPRPAPEIRTEAPARAVPAAPRPRPKASRARGSQSTADDLRLLRERPDVRNRCIAAVVVPFVLYTAALILIGSVRVYLIWVWIPLVTAGVIAGSILDSAHKRNAHRASRPPDGSSDH